MAQPRRAPRTDHDPAARRRNIAVLTGVVALIAALATAALLGGGSSPHRAAAAARVEVPLVVGQDVTAARSRLHHLHLRTRVREVPAPGVRPGTITSQKPVAGHTARARSIVRLRVSETPRFRPVHTVTTTASVPIAIRGEHWRISSTVSSADHCTLLVFCSHSSVRVLRVGAGGATTQLQSFRLGNGIAQKRVFATGPGTYELKIDPASGDTKWSIVVDDDY